MRFSRFVQKCIASYFIVRAKARPSFSQAGEDIVVSYLFRRLGIDKPTYLDIGANFPVIGNNTYFFYNAGSKGVCVEPDPELFSVIKKARPKDIVLNIGIGIGLMEPTDFFIFPHPYSGWSTFSKSEAEERQALTGVKIKKIMKLPLQSVNAIIGKYFNPFPNFLSVDVEGLDLEILKSLDFERYRPEVICAETITFGQFGQAQKTSEITEFLKSNGYFVFADTHINTIYCKVEAYKPKK